MQNLRNNFTVDKNTDVYDPSFNLSKKKKKIKKKRKNKNEIDQLDLYNIEAEDFSIVNNMYSDYPSASLDYNYSLKKYVLEKCKDNKLFSTEYDTYDLKSSNDGNIQLMMHSMMIAMYNYKAKHEVDLKKKTIGLSDLLKKTDFRKEISSIFNYYGVLPYLVGPRLIKKLSSSCPLQQRSANAQLRIRKMYPQFSFHHTHFNPDYLDRNKNEHLTVRQIKFISKAIQDYHLELSHNDGKKRIKKRHVRSFKMAVDYIKNIKDIQSEKTNQNDIT